MSLTSTQTAASPAAGRQSPALSVLTLLFFMWGLITSLNDILVPHMKEAFTLNYVQASLIQFCFFTAYFVVSFPAGRLADRFGYQRCIVIGLVTAGLGCVLFYPAAGARSYGFFLAALFVLAAGITLLQVAANPYVNILGPARTAASRLNLTQAFNALGTTVGPLVGAATILAVAGNDASADSVQTPYLILAGLLFVLAVVIALFPLPRVGSPTSAKADTGETPTALLARYPHLRFGTLGIFCYVGAEVGIGSYLVSLMAQPDIAGLAHATAGRYLALYWGGAMVGRFVGSALMRYIRPNWMLGFNALAIVVLIATALIAGGHVAMWALIAVGLFNSIMFPTIFSLSLDRLGPSTGKGSGLLCMAIVGGALLPLLQGYIADHAGLLASFGLPLVCYLYIFFFASRGYRVRASA